MKTYAYVQDGTVYNIIPPVVWEAPDPTMEDQVDPDLWATFMARVGQEIPLNQRFSPEFAAACIDITDLDPMPQERWVYDGKTFAPYSPPVLTPEQIQANNAAQQAALTTQASQAMAPVLLSLQLGDATDAETVLARAWQTYYRALQAVDLTQSSPAWPTQPA